MAPFRPLVLPAVLLLGGCVGLASLSHPVAAYPLFLAFTAVATAGWLLAVRAARGGGAGSVAAVLGVAAAARALLLVPDVPLSDDLYRYLWDGRVANAGINPFRHAPTDPALAALRDDEVWPRINHPTVPTIYPPVAQALFRGIDRVAPTPGGVRAVVALADWIGVLLLAALLRARGRPAALAVVLGWCPLAILESAGGGHVDALGAALLVAALAAGEWRSLGAAKELVVGILVGLTCQVKPVGLLLGPGLLRDIPTRRWAALGAGGLASLVLLVPYLDAGPMLARGFLTYAEHWRFNDLLYSIVVDAGVGPRATRWLLAGLLAATVIALPFRIRDLRAAAGCAVGAFLILSPTVHPWYVVWLVPFLPFLPRSLTAAGYTLVGLVPVAYATAWMQARTGEWAEPAWTRPALWLPVLAAVVIGILRNRGGEPG